MLRFKSLGSGSSGNALLIEAGTGAGAPVTRLLVDAGLGIRHLDARLAKAGLAASELSGIFITHEHADHIGCALTLALRERIPVWMSDGTHRAIGRPDFEGLLEVARDGVAIDLGGLQLMPFTVPHDAQEPLQLTCDNGARRLGVLTDLGHVSAHVTRHLRGCHALLLECNHDPDLLARSRYPDFLKQRIAGPHGHLANAASAALAGALMHSGLKHLVAAHLSEQNNRPDLARAALAGAAGCAPADIVVADSSLGTDWLTC